VSGTDDESAIDLGASTKKKQRAWSSYWAWADKDVAERGAASEILRSFGEVTNLVSRPNGEDPPDCEAILDGQFSGIEVTEFVD
jgi:hypothetical protein